MHIKDYLFVTHDKYLIQIYIEHYNHLNDVYSEKSLDLLHHHLAKARIRLTPSVVYLKQPLNVIKLQDTGFTTLN